MSSYIIKSTLKFIVSRTKIIFRPVCYWILWLISRWFRTKSYLLIYASLSFKRSQNWIACLIISVGIICNGICFVIVLHAILIIIRLFSFRKHIQLHVWLLLNCIWFLQIHWIRFFDHFTNSINFYFCFPLSLWCFIILSWSRHCTFSSLIYESSLCWSENATFGNLFIVHILYKSRSLILTRTWRAVLICRIIKSLFLAQKALIVITIKSYSTICSTNL